MSSSKYTAEQIAQAEQQVDEFFKACDANHDGKIEWKEVMAKCGAIWTEEEAKNQEKDFLSSDQNGDGMIDRKELLDRILKSMSSSS